MRIVSATQMSRSFSDFLDLIERDGEVAHAHAKLIAYCRRGGTQRSAHDLMIAATGSSTGRTIVTLDRNGFADLPSVRVR